MKIRILPWAVGVAILGCVLAVSASVSSSRMQASLIRERHSKLQTEQQLQLAAIRIKSLESRLAQSEKKFENIQAILNQGKSTANDLQSRLEQSKRENEILAKKMAELEGQAVNNDAPVSR